MNAEVPDFLEATVYNKDEAVIMVGNFTEVETQEQKKKVNQVNKWYKPWFYKHVEGYLKTVRRPKIVYFRNFPLLLLTVVV